MKEARVYMIGMLCRALAGHDKNEIYIGQSFTLNATDTNGNFTSASTIVHIVE